MWFQLKNKSSTKMNVEPSTADTISQTGACFVQFRSFLGTLWYAGLGPLSFPIQETGISYFLCRTVVGIANNQWSSGNPLLSELWLYEYSLWWLAKLVPESHGPNWTPAWWVGFYTSGTFTWWVSHSESVWYAPTSFFSLFPMDCTPLLHSPVCWAFVLTPLSNLVHMLIANAP